MDEKSAKVMLITGSTDGIGKQIALELADRGIKVLIHGRSREKCEAVRYEIQKATGNDRMRIYVADFSSFQQVRKLAEEIKSSEDRLDVLVNNAGLYSNHRQLTEDGLEMTFQVNHLAPFLLTVLLLDMMFISTPSRIVNVASTTHQSARVDFDNLQGEKYYDGYGAYALSKLGNILFTYALARRLAGKDVTVNCLHPGSINTKLLHAGFNSVGHDVGYGAQTPVYLATSPEVEGVSGKYFRHEQETESSSISYDQGLQEQFWKVSEELTNINTSDYIK
jgi:NAD(P)-dependent dehydrogenase (short-subunit alcohol dehydrogenase family)